jgi:type 1 glutamine amidotransferase
MRKFSFYFFFLLFFVPVVTYAQKSKPIHVLIVDGFSNHDWKQTTLMIKSILEETGKFVVEVSTTPTTANDTNWKNWQPHFKNFEVVIQNTNNIQDKSIRWPAEIEKELADYVSAGGGLYIFHSANNAFPHWPEYDRMIGLGWRSKETGYAIEINSEGKLVRIPPGEGKSTFHGPRFDFIIQILTNHPINKGFPRQWKIPNTELYIYPRGSAEDLTVLSYAFDTATNKNWPVEWIVHYGKGRVYNSSMGHLWKNETYPVGFRSIGFQTTLIRATEWLARRKVTYPVPKNFPTASSVNLREETDLPQKR